VRSNRRAAATWSAIASPRARRRRSSRSSPARSTFWLASTRFRAERPPARATTTFVGVNARETMPTRPTASGERRSITVLFADIAGSTSIAERMDPEDWTTLVGEAFKRMTSTIEHYDGTVGRLMGDGVLAFFGAPVAHEDDPERAVRCGLDMVQAIDELGAAQQAAGASGLRVRVGVNTGPVVVGVVGTDKASEYTAMGDTVNVAARMQASARPGSVLVTAATHRFVATLVDAVDVGLLELK